MRNLKDFLLLRIIFPIADKIMGTCAIYWYNQITKMSTWDRSEIINWQNLELQKFICHAYNNTAYYKRVFDELGIKPEEIKSPEDLTRLPIVNKDIVNNHYEEFVPKNISEIKHRKGKTGGTTGAPMLYLCDENVWGYVTAAKIFSWRKVGYKYGDKFIALGSTSLFPFGKKSKVIQIYNQMRGGLPLNGVNLTNEICEKYVNIIKKERILYIYGYAASIYILTKYVAENNIDLTQIKGVFSTSEVLTKEYRKLISETYKCNVMDCYGARDAGITAYEVKPGKYFVGYNVIAETVDNFDDNTGTVLTTNFLNYSFPLIRYQYGDDVTLINNDKDYNGQIITKVIGRTSNIMRLENGHNLTATGFAMIMKEFDIVAFEIKKTGVNIVELIIEPIKEKYNDLQEKQITQTIKKYIGEDCKLKITHINKFEPLKNGKRNYFIVE